MSSREEFCRLALQPGSNIRELCRRFEIGSATAYKWLKRYREGGSCGLADRSHRPQTSPTRSSPELEDAVLAVRSAHPRWGGRKIRHVLERQGLAAPAASTITQILRRHGRLDGSGAGEVRGLQRFERAVPNELWQMDFKGWFALPTGPCHPLTVLDDHSRYALEIGACANEREGTVRTRLEAVFRRYGRPYSILADNGPPWGTAGQGLYTTLGVWLLDLDIRLLHGRPYHPQTQGKEERFHRTLKAELLDGRSFCDLAGAQRAFDAWREVYNAHRPHQGIGMLTPAQRYLPSPRPMPDIIAPPDYEDDACLRIVDANARISYRNKPYRCPRAFIGKRLALRPTSHDGVFNLCYRSHILARLDTRKDQLQPVHNLPEHVIAISPV